MRILFSLLRLITLAPRMNRFFSWIKARHLKEGSYFKVICFDLPEICVEAAWRVLANIINGSSYIHTRNLARFRGFVATQDSRHSPVFVIAMPRTIHYLLPCLDNIPQQVRENSIDILLVANGLTCWEVNFLSSKTSFPVFKLRITPKSSMSHGHVLNLLLEGSKKDFAILDHDLYGTSSELWNELLSAQPAFMRGMFPTHKRRVNRKLPRTQFPSTRLLFFNRGTIRELMRRYKVGAQLYLSTPAHLKSLVSGLGLPDGHYLKPHLNFHDTLNLLMLLVFHEKGRCEFTDPELQHSVRHIGGTSGSSGTSADLLRTYADLKFLELTNCEELNQAYTELRCNCSSSAEWLARIGDRPGAIENAQDIDSIVDNLKPS